MKRWVKRFGLGCGVMLLAGAGTLTVLEQHRQQQASQIVGLAVDGDTVPTSAPDLERKYSSPAEFSDLCSAVQGRFGAIQARHFRSRHLRKTRVTEIDSKDEPVAITEMLDRVHYDDRTERNVRLETRQLLGNLTGDANLQNGASAKTLAPFSDDAPSGLYRYSLEAVETIADRVVLRIHFEPLEPVEGSFTGSAWVDPATGEPARMRGSAAKLPRFVDRIELLMEYGRAENGHTQMRRAVMDVVGGFAIYLKHYRIEAELSDYRPLDDNSPKSVP